MTQQINFYLRSSVKKYWKEVLALYDYSPKNFILCGKEYPDKNSTVNGQSAYFNPDLGRKPEGLWFGR